MQCLFQRAKGTLRGMHYQAAPYAETKLVRCTKGAIYDVVVDLRPDSPTFKTWIAVVLTAANRNMLYVPEGCGHGFLDPGRRNRSVLPNVGVLPSGIGRGVRWDDPAFQIVWPAEVEVISERDRTYPDFE